MKNNNLRLLSEGKSFNLYDWFRAAWHNSILIGKKLCYIFFLYLRQIIIVTIFFKYKKIIITIVLILVIVIHCHHHQHHHFHLILHHHQCSPYMRRRAPLICRLTCPSHCLRHRPMMAKSKGEHYELWSTGSLFNCPSPENVSRLLPTPRIF